MDTTCNLGGDLDEDSFLPNSGSGLASLFSKKPEKKTSNETLKYTPPKHANLNQESKGDTMTAASGSKVTDKTSECILGKVVHAHELVKGVYVSKGKLGLAIMRIHSPPHTRLVIFTAGKTTLSSVVASEYLSVTLQNDNYITYYDENAKNWSLLFLSKLDLDEVISELKLHSVKIQNITDNTSTDKCSSGEKLEKKEDNIDTEKEVDTDKETNKKINTKIKSSLISRMAMVGQAILPPDLLAKNDPNSSGDDTEHEKKPTLLPKTKGTSHKKKSGSKRHNKIIPESSESSSEIVEDIKTSKIVSVPSPTTALPKMPFTYMNGQILPMTSEISNNSLNNFISETRIANSEVRININRISDKVDQVLSCLKVSESCMPNSINTNANFTMEIYQKLLKEYEDKIKAKDLTINLLEEKIKSSKNYTQDIKTECLTDRDIDIQELKKKNEQLNNLNQNHKIEIDNLNSSLSEKNSQVQEAHVVLDKLINDNQLLQDSLCANKEDNLNLTEKILCLENKLKLYEEECKCRAANCEVAMSEESLKCDGIPDEQLHNTSEKETQCQILDLDNEIKKIMNNTFKTLAASFKIDQSYSGSDIRNTIASIIKKTTLDALKSEMQ